VRDDELAAAALGVDLYRAKLLVFALSAVLAGFAGSLYAHVFRHVSPISFGIEASLEYLLAVILAGPGTLIWPLAGATFVTALPQLPALQSLQDLRVLVYGGLLLGAVLLLPRGLGGLVAAGARPRPVEQEAEAVELPRPRLPAPAGGPLLELTGVTCRFGGVVALEQVDLVVQAGTIHGLIGPNGSGKTTAVNVVSGVLQPDGGCVRLDGRQVAGLAPHRLAELGAVRTFQNLRLFGELSVLDNIRVGLHTVLRASIPSVLLGLPAARRVERESSEQAAALGMRLGLGRQLKRPAGDLPHGLQRRLERARALAARPTLLLLDEPAAGLSQAELAELQAILGQAREAGVTIVLIEHHLDLVLELCDTVTVLDRGRVIATGRPDDVRRDPSVLAAYLGRPADEPGDAVVAGAPA
jgi:ABC-type branched-subunit amino acid transport system ATPase component